MNALVVPGLPRDDAGPVFSAPWQARAFAIALALHRRGCFAWSEWSAALGAEIALAGPASAADTSRHWLDALERLVREKGLGDRAQLHALEDAWARAAERTPHGQPIELTEGERALARGA